MRVSRAGTSLQLCSASLLVALFVIAARAQSKDIPTLARDAAPSVARIVLRDQTGKELGSGSGFVIANDGKVVTNYHVIQNPGTAQAEVRFADGATYQVEGVVATDADRDLAVLILRAVGREFVALRIGDSDGVQIGEHVVAIGSPLAGLASVSTEDTVSDGIISGRRDWPGGKMKVFQITAPLSPGSSGGALLSASGDVVGITFAQITEGQNLNFAIPVIYVRPLLTDGPIKLLSEVGSATHENKPIMETGLAGSYTGIWQSNRYSVSGAAVMTIHTQGNAVTADIFLTGGEVTTATLTGIAMKSGESIWTAQLTSKKPRLSVRAVFRGNTFVGDYSYSRFLLADQGQWTLKKE